MFRLAYALVALLLALPVARAEDAPAPAPTAPAKGNAKKGPPLKAHDPKKGRLKLPAFFGVFGPSSLIQKTGFRSAPGRYVEYRIGNTGASLRMQEVGPTTPGARWIEFFTSGGNLGEGGMRLLVRGDKDGNVERAIAMMPTLPALEIPLETVSFERPGTDGQPMPLPTPNLPLDIPVEVVGREKLTVPLGTFDTTHYRLKSDEGIFDYWIAPGSDVPFLGAVRFSQGGQTVEAVKVGSDATPKIAVPVKAR